MIKKELILQNPLRFIGDETEDILPEGGFGAVLARAGVGKTSLLVQLALNTVLRSKYVLHVSLDDPVNKISLWYKEVFSHLTKSYDAKETNKLWEDLLPYRFIMTFKVEGFSVPKLEERLTDLKEQNIFSPQMVLIDGFHFNESTRTSLSEFKRLAKNHSLHVWFAVKTHRHEKSEPEGMPSQLSDVSDLFDIIIQLQPEGKKIHVITLKGEPQGSDRPALFLDPATMLLKDNS
ncbi:MAG: AAA family ATPase [Deltaproteobacteria bacterium]|nr:AAA family ATPase [Deltaproteobacteria bacterium]